MVGGVIGVGLFGVFVAGGAFGGCVFPAGVGYDFFIEASFVCGMDIPPFGALQSGFGLGTLESLAPVAIGGLVSGNLCATGAGMSLGDNSLGVLLSVIRGCLPMLRHHGGGVFLLREYPQALYPGLPVDSRCV